MCVNKTISCNTVVTYLTMIVSTACFGADEPLMQAARDPHTGQVVIREGDDSVLQYNYLTIQPPPGYVTSVRASSRRYARARSNYIHPLYGPNGEVLTKDWSEDHPHHRGIYWAWPEVDWRGQRGDLHALQRLVARPTGNIKLQSDDACAQIEAESRWMWEDETAIVREVTTIRAHRAGTHGRYIDLAFSFEAVADDVALARRGTNAYGGLNIRLSSIKDVQLIHHADPAGTESRRAWSDSIGVRHGGGKSVGLAVFEKVTNPDYPGDYIQYPKLPWFQPTFPRSGTRYELKKDKPLILRYRLWICSGQPPTEAQYRQEWNLYQNTK